MRRTDLSRKMNKAMAVIEERALAGATLETKDLAEIVKNEIDLRAGKPVTLDTHTTVTFKDSEFEGTLKKSDIYDSHSESKDLGVKEIKNNYGMVQLIHSVDNNRVELKLVVEAEFIDNQGKKHKCYPCLKTIETELFNDGDNVEVAIANENNEAPEAVKEDDSVVAQDENKVTESVEEEKTYKDYIGIGLTKLFGDRFFGSLPSSEFIDAVTKKIHGIYVVNYLKQLYTKDSVLDNNSEGMLVIERILETL